VHKYFFVYQHIISYRRNVVHQYLDIPRKRGIKSSMTNPQEHLDESIVHDHQSPQHQEQSDVSLAHDQEHMEFAEDKQPPQQQQLKSVEDKQPLQQQHLVEQNKPTQQCIEQWKAKIECSLDAIESCTDANELPDLLYSHMICLYRAEKEVPKIWHLNLDHCRDLLGENIPLGCESFSARLRQLHTTIIVRLMDAMKDEHGFGDSKTFNEIASNVSNCSASFMKNGIQYRDCSPEEILVRIAHLTTNVGLLHRVGNSFISIRSFDHALDCFLRIFRALENHYPPTILITLCDIYVEMGDIDKAHFYISYVKEIRPDKYADFASVYLKDHQLAETYYIKAIFSGCLNNNTYERTQPTDREILRYLVDNTKLDDTHLGTIVKKLYGNKCRVFEEQYAKTFLSRGGLWWHF
jgi:hypothetical protein